MVYCDRVMRGLGGRLASHRGFLSLRLPAFGVFGARAL